MGSRRHRTRQYPYLSLLAEVGQVGLVGQVDGDLVKWTEHLFENNGG